MRKNARVILASMIMPFGKIRIILNQEHNWSWNKNQNGQNWIAEYYFYLVSLSISFNAIYNNM